MRTEKGHLVSLDSLRGLAALAVCLFHSPALFGRTGFLPHAYIAVDFFFVLSGFILYYRYGEVLSQPAPHSVTGQNYIVRRLARLYPLFLLAMLGGFALMILRLAMNGELEAALGPLSYALVSGMVMMPVIDTGPLVGGDVLFPFVGAAWSVFWEIVLSIAFVFWAKARFRFVPQIGFVALLALCVLAWPMGTIDGGWRLETFHIGGLRAVVGFSLGIIVARLYARLDPALPPRRRHLISAIVFALVCAVAAYVALGPEATSLAVELVLLAIVFPAIVLLSAHAAPRFLVNRVGLMLGAASYSLYLLHGIFRDAGLFILKRMDWIAPSLPVGLAWLLATLAASYLCWRFYETPARKWLTAAATRRFGWTTARPATERI